MKDIVVFKDILYSERSKEFNWCLNNMNSITIVLTTKKLVFLNADDEILLITDNIYYRYPLGDVLDWEIMACKLVV